MLLKNETFSSTQQKINDVNGLETRDKLPTTGRQIFVASIELKLESIPPRETRGLAGDPNLARILAYIG